MAALLLWIIGSGLLMSAIVLGGSVMLVAFAAGAALMLAVKLALEP